MEPTELERRVSDELRRLPGPKAPGSLLPRVMAAVRARAARPWYQRAWTTWPVGWRVASTAAAVALVVAIGLSGGVLEGWTASVAWPWTGVATAARTWFTDLVAVREAVFTVWRALILPFSWYLVVAVALSWAASATFSVALSRVAFGEAIES